MTSKKNIAFQGEPGAYSNLACNEACPDLEPMACESFEEAFAAVADGSAVADTTCSGGGGCSISSGSSAGVGNAAGADAGGGSPGSVAT